jgi:hypothetical protein
VLLRNTTWLVSRGSQYALPLWLVPFLQFNFQHTSLEIHSSNTSSQIERLGLQLQGCQIPQQEYRTNISPKQAEQNMNHCLKRPAFPEFRGIYKELNK